MKAHTEKNLNLFRQRLGEAVHMAMIEPEPSKEWKKHTLSTLKARLREGQKVVVTQAYNSALISIAFDNKTP